MSAFADLKHQLMAVAILAVSANAFGQGPIRELAREQGRRDPNGTVYMPASPGDYDVQSIEDLVRSSVAVVTGRLVGKGSYLSSNENYVFSEYSLSNETVIRGSLSVLPASVPGQTIWPSVVFWGGEVVVEGIQVLASNQNFDALQDGSQYLLFLMPARLPGVGRYEVYSGAIFEISSKQVKPLLKRGDHAFPWSVNFPPTELLSRIRSAGR